MMEMIEGMEVVVLMMTEATEGMAAMEVMMAVME